MKLLPLLLIIALAACKPPKEADKTITQNKIIFCDEVRNGTFKMVFNVTPDDTAIVTRQDTLQKEEYPARGIYITNRITWTDTCSYILELIETNNAEVQQMQGVKVPIDISGKRGDTIFFLSKTNNPVYPYLEGWMMKIQ